LNCLFKSGVLLLCAFQESHSEEDTEQGVHQRVKHDKSSKKNLQTISTPTTASNVVDLAKTFPVHIGIERAFHLPMTLDNR